MSFRYFVLGLLAQQPMSGYDFKSYLGSLDWLVRSPSFGSVYSNLHALLEDGLVEVEVIQNEDRPTRKVYSITEAGTRVLQEWVSEPLDSSGSLKAFLRRLCWPTACRMTTWWRACGDGAHRSPLIEPPWSRLLRHKIRR